MVKRWLQVQTRFGDAAFATRIAELPTITGSVVQRANGVGNGRVTLPANYDRLDEILKPDPADPGNMVASTVRLFIEGTTTPRFTWIPNQMVSTQGKADPDVETEGPGLESVLGYARLEPWDWDGNDDWDSSWPDWIYGGREILGPVNTTFQPHIFTVTVIGTGGAISGNVGIQVSINGGGFQTATVAWNASAATVQIAIVALSNVDEAEVTGLGTEQNPWEIKIIAPSGTYTTAISTNPTNAVARIALEQFGKLIPIGWTESRVGNTTVPHGILTDFRASDGSGSDPDLPAGCSAWVVFLGQEWFYPGVQKIVNVQAGGIYQAPPLYLYAEGGSATQWRVVIRDLYENLIASEEITLTPSTLTLTTGMQNIIIPEGITQVVFRVGHIGSGTPPRLFIGCPSLKEGLAPTTVGDIAMQMHEDAVADHLPRCIWEIGATAATYLTLDFDDVNDSNGDPWADAELSMTFKRGQSYLRVYAEFMKLGYEVRVVDDDWTVGTLLVQMYNPGGMGTDYSADDDGPVIEGGRDPSARDVRRFLPNFTDVSVEGDEQRSARVRSSDAIDTMGRRESYAPEQDLSGFDVIGLSAVEGLANELTQAQSLNYTLVPAEGADLPLVRYTAADTVNVEDPPEVTKQARRVESVRYAWDQMGDEFTLQLGSESFVGLAGWGEGVRRLLAEFKAIRQRPDADPLAIEGGCCPSCPAILQGSAASVDTGENITFAVNSDPDSIMVADPSVTSGISFREPGLYLVVFNWAMTFTLSTTGWVVFEFVLGGNSCTGVMDATVMSAARTAVNSTIRIACNMTWIAHITTGGSALSASFNMLAEQTASSLSAGAMADSTRRRTTIVRLGDNCDIECGCV